MWLLVVTAPKHFVPWDSMVTRACCCVCLQVPGSILKQMPPPSGSIGGVGGVGGVAGVGGGVFPPQLSPQHIAMLSSIYPPHIQFQLVSSRTILLYELLQGSFTTDLLIVFGDVYVYYIHTCYTSMYVKMFSVVLVTCLEISHLEIHFFMFPMIGHRTAYLIILKPTKHFSKT